MRDSVRARRGHRSTWLIVAILACAVLADRAVVIVSSGGRGVLALVVIVAPLLAAVAIARQGFGRTFAFASHPAFAFGVLPYLVLTALLPVLGVMLTGYPERTLLAITAATTALSFMVLGAALSLSDGESSEPDRHPWSPWLLIAIAAQLLYAAGQAIYLSRGPGWQLFLPFHAWDRSVGGALGQLVEARSLGLYINPNELGLWAGVAAIMAWTMLPARLRGLGVAMAVLTLLLSQSRGAGVALLAVLVVGVALTLARGRLSAPGALKAIVSLAVAGGLAIGLALTLAPKNALVQRFGALIQVAVQGPRADPNLAGRLDYWSAVTALNRIYPLGTLGPPELLLGSAVDSTWFRAFSQGSIPYAASLALMLGVSLLVGDQRYRLTLRLMTVMIAVAGLTMDPFGYPVIYLYWVLLGAALQSEVTARLSVRRPWGRRRGVGLVSPAGSVNTARR
jgi:GNAT superfamily N-acetyltransferase